MCQCTRLDCNYRGPLCIDGDKGGFFGGSNGRLINMKGSLKVIWLWVKWPVLVLVVAYGALVIWRTFVLFDEDKTKEAVAGIHAARITLADVNGDNLPPVPDQAENDATVEGVDKNNNGIRDDVELAIFAKYPNDKKARAAALQYAMTEQMYLTKVTNMETWKAVAEEVGRAESCLIRAKTGSEDFELISDLVFNSSQRKAIRTEVFNYITSHGDAEGTPCDIAI
jgi:hypothetical protein